MHGFCGLNKIMKRNCYPLPLNSEAVDCLSGARYITKLDIREAYHRLRIASGNKWKAVCRTQYGHYKYTVITFGLDNVLAALKGHINMVLCIFLNLFCRAYLDDIAVNSNSLAEHEEHVRLIHA